MESFKQTCCHRPIDNNIFQRIVMVSLLSVRSPVSRTADICKLSSNAKPVQLLQNLVPDSHPVMTVLDLPNNVQLLFSSLVNVK